VIARIIRMFILPALILVAVNRASAHPLGNFSINQYSALSVGRDSIRLRYVIDMAEIPTFQELQASGVAPIANDPAAQRYLAKKVETLSAGLFLEINGRQLPLHEESKKINFPPGAGGLPTLKIGVLYEVNFPANGDSPQYSLNYRDNNFAGRAGWKEIVAVSESGVNLVNSSIPLTDRSAELTNYPTDLLNSPPQQLDARVEFTWVGRVGTVVSGKAPGTDSGIDNPVGEGQLQSPTNSVIAKHAGYGGHRPLPKEARTVALAQTLAPNQASDGTQLQINKPGTPRDSFTELVASPDLGWSIVFIALAVAVGLGAFHALEPGHGKTLVAAYLVGSRGTMRHALILGLIVTAAHTAGVYFLGGVTIYASQYVVPERLYPWLSVASGLMITILGAVIFLKRYRGKGEAHSHHHHNHRHTHNHSHARKLLHHYDHSDVHEHSHGHGSHAHHHHATASFRELVTLGISGGIVPCPAALVVLLSAVSMNRVGFGLLLIVAFSAGLAAVLIAIGILMVNARQYMSRFLGEGKWVTQWLPMTSSALIVVFGFGLTWQAWRSAGFSLLGGI